MSISPPTGQSRRDVHKVTTSSLPFTAAGSKPLLINRYLRMSIISRQITRCHRGTSTDCGVHTSPARPSLPSAILRVSPGITCKSFIAFARHFSHRMIPPLYNRNGPSSQLLVMLSPAAKLSCLAQTDRLAPAPTFQRARACAAA